MWNTATRACIIFIGLLLGAAPAASQEFPSRLIRFVVPNAPGNTPDTLARVLAPELGKFLGQSVVVENRPGAGAILGFEYVATQAPADGYTIMMALVTDLATAPLTVKSLRFDPLKDLPPITGLVELRQTLGSSVKMPWKSVAEMVAYGRANPGKLNYGSSSPTVRLTIEGVVRALGIDAMHVPYSSGGPYLQAVLSGELSFGFAGEGTALSWGDKYRILAQTGEGRSASLPDVPTFAELGQPAQRGVIFGLHVRASTPRTATDKLHAAAVWALQQPEPKAAFRKLRLEPIGNSPALAAKRLADEARVLADIAKQVGLQPQ